MRNVLLIIGLCVLAISVPAQSNLKPAPDLSVFGLKLGEKFTVPECPRSDVKITSDRVYYKYSKEVCFEQIPYSKDEGSAVNRWVKFAYTDAPQIISSNTITVLVMDGNLEGIGFNTLGTSADTMVLEKLKEKYGEPSKLFPSKVQNRMGATFDKFIAVWVFTNIEVSFQSVVSSIDSGLVNIDTMKGLAWRDAMLKELTKDKRPL